MVCNPQRPTRSSFQLRQWVIWESLKPRRTTVKLTTIALASVLVLSSTFAFAYGRVHHSGYHHGQHGHHGTVGKSSARATGPNNRGGLVGGGDAGTYKP
jgi:hypothetical protein